MMDILEALEILQVEKGVADLEISNGSKNQNLIMFSEACEVITDSFAKHNETLKRLEHANRELIEEIMMLEEF